MNERFFQFAREASLKSDYTRRGSAPRIGAIAVYKGSIVAEAWNTLLQSGPAGKIARRNHARSAFALEIRRQP